MLIDHRRGLRAILLAGLVLCLLPSPSRANLTITAIPGGKTVIEGGPNFQIDFRVTNTTGFNLLLDYALATIDILGNPDSSDYINFAGQGGSNGLASAPLSIPNGGSGDFVYNLMTSTPPTPDNTDHGENRVNFTIEMSVLTAPPPNPNNISSAIGHLTFVDLTPLGTVPDPAALATLLNFQQLAPGQTLYPTLTTFTASTNPQTPGSSPSPIVKVLDTPEPSSAVAGGASVLLCLACRLWHRRHRGGCVTF
jgi:hypothetical protein